MEITKRKTHRGFDLIEFKDFNNEKCSLQESSLATESAIWLGVDDANPKIMASKAIQLGINTKGIDCGWIDYNVPDDVLFTTRMHLTQEQVKELLPYLQRFADKGEL